MPIYEYTCGECHRRSSVFYRTFSEAEHGQPSCPHCQSTNLRRAVSRVVTLRSEESRLETFEDPSLLGGLDQEDPRAVAGLMRRMSAEMGEPLDEEISEVMGRMEAGESMESIEASMPELGSADAGASAGIGGPEE